MITVRPEGSLKCQFKPRTVKVKPIDLRLNGHGWRGHQYGSGQSNQGQRTIRPANRRMAPPLSTVTTAQYGALELSKSMA
jgi:hypothetical protein